MPDWTKSMQQTFEYYEIDPTTWKDKTKITNVVSSTIDRDSDADTLGSATIDVVDMVGESYIRIYLVTLQNGIREKFPLATVLVQTPSSSFDGKIREVSMDAYTPLIELKEKMPPIGYSLMTGDNILSSAHRIIVDNMRAPVIETKHDKDLDGPFVANTDDTWMTYIKDLLAGAEYELQLDEMGRVLYSPIQDTDTLQPVWTYSDDNSSILYSDISLEHDLYDIPNAVEVIFSTGSKLLYSKVVNDNPNSSTSTVTRGREILYRDTSPSIPGIPSQLEVDRYAKQLLKNLSTIEYTIKYTHGYCPVRIGDCVRLNYERSGIMGVKAKVISQSIKCVPGCPVSETAVYTVELWGDN